MPALGPAPQAHDGPAGRRRARALGARPVGAILVLESDPKRQHARLWDHESMHPQHELIPRRRRELNSHWLLVQLPTREVNAKLPIDLRGIFQAALPNNEKSHLLK